jgi:hypothetical protein
MDKAAIAAGRTHAADPMDHGFMYGWSFHDLDGYHWFYMAPAAVAPQPTPPGAQSHQAEMFGLDRRQKSYELYWLPFLSWSPNTWQPSEAIRAVDLYLSSRVL